MGKGAVVNASPLIYLTAAGHLGLLRLASETVAVPRSVADEIRRWGGDDAVVQALEETDWLLVVADPPVPQSIQAWDLGAGETAVLSYALRENATAVLDDRAGRRCARVHRIDLRGTLGLVLVAKQRRKIAEARPVLERLRNHGMYLFDAVLDRALALVGE